MTTWASGRLDERNDLSRFDCGVPALNRLVLKLSTVRKVLGR